MHAIIGLSRRIETPGNEVAMCLMNNGYQAIPVNPRSYPSVSGIPGGVDLVVVFRRSEIFPDVVRDIIEASPKYLWLQLGIRNDAAVVDAETRGITVYQDVCIEQTHQRLLKRITT